MVKLCEQLVEGPPSTTVVNGPMHDAPLLDSALAADVVSLATTENDYDRETGDDSGPIGTVADSGPIAEEQVVRMPTCVRAAKKSSRVAAFCGCVRDTDGERTGRVTCWDPGRVTDSRTQTKRAGGSFSLGETEGQISAPANTKHEGG